MLDEKAVPISKWLMKTFEELMTDIDRHTGKLIGRADSIKQSIEALLRTRKGERLFRPQIGVSFQSPKGTAEPGLTPEIVRDQCAEALAQYEPRIEVKDIQPRFVDDQLEAVTITYSDVDDGAEGSVEVHYTAWPSKG
ncbi:GPW/gp25 family protein [Bradyrhizobium sp. IC3195]|uniref:GPW/gp25 family protein n=1 Tax=Bradyrhizobium sp. IC3195 TaxID=2793804 RepID=UPI001CD359CB|nr:GPW/gp25 family protein [Bradyrhizobium sp. IC3195]MCA1471929.1 GPW/gp25 family protein [Bradyrhizobium sp. IC3195]